MESKQIKKQQSILDRLQKAGVVAQSSKGKKILKSSNYSAIIGSDKRELEVR